MLLMEYHQRESRQVMRVNTSESAAIVRRNKIFYVIADINI